MRAKAKDKQPNQRLRFEREARGWTQQYVAEQLGADINIVSRWECGERRPGPYYRRKLCGLFGMSAIELNLVDAQAASDPSPNTTSQTPLPVPIPDAPMGAGAIDSSLDKQNSFGAYSSAVARQQPLVQGS